MEHSQRIHRTFPIPFEEFEAGHLKPMSHNEEEIVDAMVRNFTRKGSHIDNPTHSTAANGQNAHPKNSI